MRDLLRGRFVHVLGDGKHTSAWFDEWSSAGQIISIVRRRDIIQAGLSLSDSVADIIQDGEWRWPSEWVDRFIILSNLAPPALTLDSDVVKWKDRSGNNCDFSIKHVWESLRPTAPQVHWFSIVWHPYCIPRYAFVLWLLVGEKLKTQDRLQAWEISQGDVITCALCNMVPDSHDHLFFSCGIASRVWSLVLQHCDLPITTHAWKDFTHLLSPFISRNLARFVIIKLLLAASVYFVWQERNRRLFKKSKRSPEQVFEVIYSTVRLKLMSFKWKSTLSALRLKSD
ncbi:uncharacterized protein [Rutidosis leptorrhynchoides]|uniref:uncharacterized protein n=1 Tax=Rutidosis leptorrhynchoides TaxID=125765 RepID=UPI003A999F86